MRQPLTFSREHSSPESSSTTGSSESYAAKPVSIAGFTLIEAIIAMVILMVALLGVFHVYTYATLYNAGNASRSQALAILQQEVEFLRSKKFSPSAVDTELSGGVKPDKFVNAPNGGTFRVQTSVDDKPFVDGVNVDAASELKEITVTVTLGPPSAGWQLAAPATVVLRRTRGN